MNLAYPTKSGKLNLFRMSHFPCIRPSLLNKKWIIQETKLNRIEIVRRKEEALLQKFKLISKQGTFRGYEFLLNSGKISSVKNSKFIKIQI